MAKKRELKVEIAGDSTSGQKAFDDLGNKSEQSSSRLGRAGDFMRDKLEKVGIGGGTAAAGVDLLGGSTAGAITPMEKGAAVVGALTAVVAKGIGDFVGLAGEVRNFKQLSGATAEESSKFVAVLDDFGIASGTGANAIFKLGRGAEANADKLAALGVEIAKNADGTTNLTETTLNVADAYARTTDPAKRAELVTQAFGKAGKDLIPVLEQGRKGLAEFFEGAESGRQIFSDEDLAKAREYELAVDALGDATSGLSREIGSAAVPAVAKFTTTLAELITTGDEALGSVGGLETVFDGIARGVLNVLGPIGQFAAGKQALDDFRGGTEDVADAQADAEVQADKYAEATDEVAESQRDAAAAAKEEEKALNDLMSAQAGSIDADIRLENAVRKTKDAQDEAAEAFRLAAEAKGKDEEANRKNEDAVAALKSALVDQAKATADKIVTDREAAGVTVDATEKNALLRDALLNVASTLAPGNALRTELEGYAAGLQNLPAAKETIVTAKAQGVAEVEAQFRALERQGITVQVNFEPNLGQLARAADAAGDPALANRLRAGQRAGYR